MKFLPPFVMIVFALGLNFAPVQAQNLNTAAAHIKINFVQATWLVNADATHVFEAAVEREALSEQGAQIATKFSQMYNKALQRLEVLDAYTLKADGRKIPVGKDGIQTQSGIANGGVGASLPEAEIVQITFRDVQAGDRTGWKIRTTTHTPQLPNWASHTDFLIPNIDTDKFSTRIEAPQSLDLQVFASGMIVSTSQSGLNQIWQIEGSQVGKVIDDYPANTLVSYPRLYASTFKKHTELVTAYATQENAKAVVTDEVKALAKKITEDATTPAERTRVLYDWVRKNIRYVAVYLGTGGWVPHDVGWILKNRYGDCKDHALLLQTLLKAVDIEAVPVLINTNSEYELAELPIGFNHCIIYIPSLNLFADPTDSRIPFGSLSWADSGKPVVVALREGAQVMRTPTFDATSNRVVVKSKFNIAKSGNATGSIEIDTNGYAATTLQDHLAQIPAGMGGVAIQKILESSRLRGRGFTQYSAVQRDSQVQSLKINDLEINNLLNDPSGGAVAPHPALNIPVYILSQMGNYTAAKRDFAFLCTPVQLREEFELTLDPAFSILRVPNDLKEMHADGIAFESQYVRTGNRITGWRELTLSHPRQVCSAAEYAARKPSMNLIAQHLRAGILYQQ